MYRKLLKIKKKNCGKNEVNLAQGFLFYWVSSFFNFSLFIEAMFRSQLVGAEFS